MLSEVRPVEGPLPDVQFHRANLSRTSERKPGRRRRCHAGRAAAVRLPLLAERNFVSFYSAGRVGAGQKWGELAAFTLSRYLGARGAR